VQFSNSRPLGNWSSETGFESTRLCGDDLPQGDFAGVTPRIGVISEWPVIRPECAVATVAENRAYSVPRHFEARDFDVGVVREAQAVRAVGGFKLPNRYQNLLLIAGDDRSIDLA
jgi:hypothetical protein